MPEIRYKEGGVCIFLCVAARVRSQIALPDQISRGAPRMMYVPNATPKRPLKKS